MHFSITVYLILSMGVLCLSLSCLEQAGLAQDQPPVESSEPPLRHGTGIDAQENVFGATNINATTGHGRLTVGVSKDGDITVLSWPSPSYNDQLAYRSSNAIDARSQPRFGAPEGAGMFLGLKLVLANGESQVTWFRNQADWESNQNYGPKDGPNPHTFFHHPKLGLRAEVVDAISPKSDTLVRKVMLKKSAQSPVRQAWLLSYANLSPLPPESRIAQLPVVDWLLDGQNDFAALWDQKHQAVIHFHPSNRRIYTSAQDIVFKPDPDWGSIGQFLQAQTLTPEEVGLLPQRLDAEYGPGAYLAMGSVPPPDQHQIGFDQTPFCAQAETMIENIKALPKRFSGFHLPLNPLMLETLKCFDHPIQAFFKSLWRYPAQDPLSDANDGELSGHLLAAGEVAEALRTPFIFNKKHQAEAALVLGAGRDYSETLQALKAGQENPDTLIQDALNTSQIWLKNLTIPGQHQAKTSPKVYQTARRALLNLRVGTDAHSGAIVASISRQPPYYLDWPRDGAFFNILLDITGQSELTARRMQLYSQWQRKKPVPPTALLDPPPPVDPETGQNQFYPAFAWEMNYFADGLPGGSFRFEIDTTAFALWSLIAHTGWEANPKAYLQTHWEALSQGANLLARWRDPITQLHAPAQEDDARAYTQTLHGAISVFGALDIAARAARLLGHDQAAASWENRARELRTALKTHAYDAHTQSFFMAQSNRLPVMASGMKPIGPTAWLVWPFPLYPYEDPHIQRQLKHDYEVIKAVLDFKTPGGLYYMKNTISLALAGDKTYQEIIADLPSKLAAQATSDTQQFGEVMINSYGKPEQRVSTPHLWEGALFFLTAMAAENPAALLKYERILPPSRVLYPE